jgi:hypothetical protein
MFGDPGSPSELPQDCSCSLHQHKKMVQPRLLCVLLCYDKVLCVLLCYDTQLATHHWSLNITISLGTFKFDLVLHTDTSLHTTLQSTVTTSLPTR